jgi:sulfoxide reductase heme-binding subunit YedZ
VEVIARNRRLQLAGWVAALAPLALLAANAAAHRLGANPIEAVLNRLGFWTLTFLTLSLAPTPLHRWGGPAWPLRLRRLLGVTAFAYAALHFSWYLGVDQFFDLEVVAADVIKRPFITVGFAALLLLLPLAVTSTDGWVRRLGFARWKALHRLAYAAALLGVIHFAWRVKADRLKPALFAAAIGLLLLARLRPAPAKR